MKIYLNHSIHKSITQGRFRQKQEVPADTSATSTNTSKVFTYANINFCAATKLVPINVKSELSQQILKKMQFFDKIVPNLAKTSKPVEVIKQLTPKNQFITSRLVHENENKITTLFLDKTNEKENKYILESFIKKDDDKYILCRFQCITNNNGQMVNGEISDSINKLSFERNNKNKRRLVLENNKYRTEYLPCKDDANIWLPIASHSTTIRSLWNNNLLLSDFGELFMELVKQNTSIK